MARRAWLLACAALVAFVLAAGPLGCNQVPDPAKAGPNYLRSMGFKRGPGDIVLLHWRRDAMPLGVYVPPVPPRFGSPGDGFEQAIYQALLSWADRIEPGLPSFAFVAEPGDARIVVEWLDAHPPDADWAIANTEYAISGKRFDIERIVVSARWPGGELANAEEVRARMIHEFGHALGMGHSPWAEDAMYARPGAQEPTPRDIETLRLLYASPNGRRILR